METEKTTFQKIMEQKAEQIRAAIEQAIDDGAKLEKRNSYIASIECCTVDGLLLQKSTTSGTITVVLHFKSDKISKVFEPNLTELREQAKQKREELQRLNKQIDEIEMNVPQKH